MIHIGGIKKSHSPVPPSALAMLSEMGLLAGSTGTGAGDTHLGRGEILFLDRTVDAARQPCRINLGKPLVRGTQHLVI